MAAAIFKSILSKNHPTAKQNRLKTAKVFPVVTGKIYNFCDIVLICNLRCMQRNVIQLIKIHSLLELSATLKCHHQVKWFIPCNNKRSCSNVNNKNKQSTARTENNFVSSHSLGCVKWMTSMHESASMIPRNCRKFWISWTQFTKPSNSQWKLNRISVSAFSKCLAHQQEAETAVMKHQSIENQHIQTSMSLGIRVTPSVTKNRNISNTAAQSKTNMLHYPLWARKAAADFYIHAKWISEKYSSAWNSEVRKSHTNNS